MNWNELYSSVFDLYLQDLCEQYMIDVQCWDPQQRNWNFYSGARNSLIQA